MNVPCASLGSIASEYDFLSYFKTFFPTPNPLRINPGGPTSDLTNGGMCLIQGQNIDFNFQRHVCLVQTSWFAFVAGVWEQIVKPDPRRWHLTITNTDFQTINIVEVFRLI